MAVVKREGNGHRVDRHEVRRDKNIGQRDKRRTKNPRYAKGGAFQGLVRNVSKVLAEFIYSDQRSKTRTSGSGDVRRKDKESPHVNRKRGVQSPSVHRRKSYERDFIDKDGLRRRERLREFNKRRYSKRY